MGYYESLYLGNDLTIAWGLDSGVLKIEGQADTPITSILDEPVDTHEMEPAAGQVPQMDTLKIWPSNQSVKPPLGSVIVPASDGVYWTILSVRFKNQVNCYEAHCRNLSILPSEANTATILKARFSKGRANEAKATWLGIYSGVVGGNSQDRVTARFQLLDEASAIAFNSEWVKETYKITLESQSPIEFAGGEYRILDSQNNRYRILKHYDALRIDILPCLIAVRIIEGAEYWQSGPPSPLPMPPFPHA